MMPVHLLLPLLVVVVHISAFLPVVAWVVFSVMPVAFLPVVAWVVVSHDACSLSSSGGLGGVFCDACTLSSRNASENGSIFNSNVPSSLTILCHLELDSSSCVLCDALLLRTHFSACCLLKAANSHCLGETGTSPGGCWLCLDFEMSSIFCT